MGDKDVSKIDKELVKTVVMAIKAGFYHLDSTFSLPPYPL